MVEGGKMRCHKLGWIRHDRRVTALKEMMKDDAFAGENDLFKSWCSLDTRSGPSAGKAESA